ncbi:MAG: branched-chain amino acid ABC transporter permease [Candidimonas sp.]|nr:MAG: branched-chain amino acid ABC transporter permease [Candidimonas sp.]
MANLVRSTSNGGAVASEVMASDADGAQDVREGGVLDRRGAMGVGLIILLLAMWLLGYFAGTDLQTMLSLTIWGVMLGAIIALGGIGLTLCYGVLKFPNFAHGDLVTLGAYITYAVVALLPHSQPIWRFSFGWELVAGLLIAVPITGAVAVLLDLALYRKLRRSKSALVLFAMASLAMAFFLRSVVYLLWGSDFHFFYVGRANPALHLPFGIRVQADQLFVFGLALVMMILIYWLLARTKMGKAMRATADNPDLAQVRGINTEKVVGWTWAIGGGLAAVSGVMYGLASQLRPDMGFVLLLPMFAGVIMGGIGSAFGAFVGCVVIGIAIQLTSAFMSPAYGPAVAFVLMILTLMVRPQGLFAEK